jgi:hypothetical protein
MCAQTYKRPARTHMYSLGEHKINVLQTQHAITYSAWLRCITCLLLFWSWSQSSSGFAPHADQCCGGSWSSNTYENQLTPMCTPPYSINAVVQYSGWKPTTSLTNTSRPCDAHGPAWHCKNGQRVAQLAPPPCVVCAWRAARRPSTPVPTYVFACHVPNVHSGLRPPHTSYRRVKIETITCTVNLDGTWSSSVAVVIVLSSVDVPT